MATTKNYKDFLLDQLSILDSIQCKSMMGEYILYYKGILFGGIYDNRLLIKKVDSNKQYGLKEVVPYNGAKLMYLIDDVDDQEFLREIIETTCTGLIYKD